MAPTPRWSAVVAGYRVSARPQIDADRPFARDLYVSHRWEEMLVVDWTDEQRRAFLHDQFRMQWAHYQSEGFAGTEYSIIEIEGEPAGRLYLFDQNPTETRIVEIGLTQEWRGRGVGGGLLAMILERAGAAGKLCSIHVERMNRARNLYLRLGFRDVSPVGPYVLMQWRPVS